jgi:hypothetical protein
MPPLTNTETPQPPKKLLQAYKIKEPGAYIGVTPESNDATT